MKKLFPLKMILADEHISAKMIAAIRAVPLEVTSVKEKFKGAKDNRIIEFARVNDLIILTEDKDFGEWIFAITCQVRELFSFAIILNSQIKS